MSSDPTFRAPASSATEGAVRERYSAAAQLLDISTAPLLLEERPVRSGGGAAQKNEKGKGCGWFLKGSQGWQGFAPKQ